MNRKKILIVDDEDGIVEEVREFFLEEGYEVVCANTAAEGIKRVKEERPGIALVDLKLPDMSGVEVLIAAKAFDPSIKVIVNTGYVDPVMQERAEKSGADAFLNKPFDLEILMDAIEKLSD